MRISLAERNRKSVSDATRTPTAIKEARVAQQEPQISEGDTKKWHGAQERGIKDRVGEHGKG